MTLIPEDQAKPPPWVFDSARLRARQERSTRARAVLALVREGSPWGDYFDREDVPTPADLALEDYIISVQRMALFHVGNTGMQVGRLLGLGLRADVAAPGAKRPLIEEANSTCSTLLARMAAWARFCSEELCENGADDVLRLADLEVVAHLTRLQPVLSRWGASPPIDARECERYYLRLVEEWRFHEP